MWINWRAIELAVVVLLQKTRTLFVKKDFLPDRLDTIALETLGMENVTKSNLVLDKLKSWRFCTPGLKICWGNIGLNLSMQFVTTSSANGQTFPVPICHELLNLFASHRLLLAKSSWGQHRRSKLISHKIKVTENSLCCPVLYPMLHTAWPKRFNSSFLDIRLLLRS